MCLPTARCTDSAGLPIVNDHIWRLCTIFTSRIFSKSFMTALKSRPFGVPNNQEKFIINIATGYKGFMSRL